MRKKWQRIWLLAVAVLFGWQAFALAADEGGMRIVLPGNMTSLSGGSATLAVAVDPRKIDTVSAGVNKTPPIVLPVADKDRNRRPDGMISICAILTLDEGENIVTVNGYRQGKEVVRESLKLFYAAKSSRDKSVAPPAYRAVPFHTTRGEAMCVDCHKGLMLPVKKMTLPADSPCLGCHPQIVAEKFKHGPAAVGDCVSCHAASGTSKYGTAKPLKKLCFTCHEEAMKPWQDKKYTHGPTATGDCAICHDPHSSAEKFFLRKKTNALCIGCHEEKATGKHVIASYVFGNTHPLAGGKNPMQPDRDFSCASCHSPHAANSRELFAFEAQGGKMGICQACHKK
ncbi:MAG: cytochrome c3 family protein [Syntrophales bacterium]